MNIKQLKKEIKGVFIQPKKSYYLGKLKYGTPYFYPINFNSSTISIRKLKLRENYDEYITKYPHLKNSEKAKFSNIPMVRRSKNWIIKLFSIYYYIEIGYPFKIKRTQLGWKDKWNSPRFEWSPMFQIFFFKWQFCIFWNAPDNDNDKYYEMILWYLEYSDKDINKAEKSWSWADISTKESTWNKKYLV